MKRIHRILAIALPILVLASCRPDQPTDPGPAYGAGDGVVGTWEQSGAVIYDLSLPVPESQDVSAFYAKAGNAWVISFSDDGSYVVDQQGKGPDMFGTSGTWNFDTAYYPTEMTVIPTGETGSELSMLNAPRANDVHFGLSFVVQKCGEDVAKYELKFTRQ